MKPKVALTPRERQMIALIARGGYTNKRIADEMGISPHTVATMMGNIFEKLDIHDRASIVVYALREGLAA